MINIMNAPCALCAQEYIEEHMKGIKDLPDDQKKASKIEKILHDAHQFSCKTVAVIHCRMGNHEICSDHLYKLIDMIKDHELDITENI